MVQNILAALARRSCYSFAVTLLSVAGGQAAGLVGFLYIAVTLDLPWTNDTTWAFVVLFSLISLAAAVHYLLYGLAWAFGKSWCLSWLKPLNTNMDGSHFVDDTAPEDWPTINRALERMPLASTKLAAFLALAVVGVFMAVVQVWFGSVVLSLGVVKGGLIVTTLYVMFSYTIIELLTSPARREARRNLIRLHPEALPRSSGRLSIKLGLFLILILIGVVITHGISIAPRTSSSTMILVCFGGGVLLLGCCVAVLVFLSITRPLDEIRESAALLSAANRAEFSSSSLDREFIVVARGFYRYAQQVVDYRRKLQELNQALENRVSERTLELSQANRELERRINEARQTSLALRASEEKYRMLIEKMQDGVFLLHKGRLVFTNESLCLMLGYSVEELQKKSFEDIIAPEDLERATDYYRLRLAGGELPDLYELKLIHRDGRRIIPVLLSVGLVHDADGEAYTLGAAKDITVLKAAEEDRAKRARLEGVMAMAGAACHELNQPLQAAYGQCEIAMLRLSGENDLYRRFEAIMEELDKLGELTGKIQRITRDETIDYLGYSSIIDIHKASEKN